MRNHPLEFGKRKLVVAGDMLMEGSRILSSGMLRKVIGYRTYPGSAKQICDAIVRRCYDRERGYFRTSLTTYTDFWARDFGRCVPALLKLGYRDEVVSSYRYALSVYRRRNQFALVITPRGNLFDFPYYAPDGFAFFLKGLALLDAPHLVDQYRPFLNKEMHRFVEKVVDVNTGLVRTDRHFSEAQDYAKRTSSCYSNAMCHLVQQAAFRLCLENPLARYDYIHLIWQYFWNGDHFYDDLIRLPHISGDACITPFLANAVAHPEHHFPKVLKKMDAEGLTRPYLARYGNTAKKNRPMIRIERFNKWQRDTVWTCLGLQLLEVLKHLHPERYLAELLKYEHMIERLHCFPEVLIAKTDVLFKGPFYMSDDSMLWAADLLSMLKERDENRR